jgi:CRP/FNR family transcriptional regulator, cyclic AMP receptor protein
MIGSNGLKVMQKCDSCALSDREFFCKFSPETERAFAEITVRTMFAKGSRLFIEGQPAKGIFLLCSGRAKLTVHSLNGKALILRVAYPGEVLGLESVFSDSISETTAEALEPCQVNFVCISEFRHFLEQYPDASINAIRQLGKQNRNFHSKIRSLGLSSCVADKLAALLLEWSKNGIANNGSVHLTNYFSHEEIAEMIGTSRETVTRGLKDFRERDLIEIKGSTIFIPNKKRLEAAIGNGKR